jgi:hypothetical protein
MMLKHLEPKGPNIPHNSIHQANVGETHDGVTFNVIYVLISSLRILLTGQEKTLNRGEGGIYYTHVVHSMNNELQVK